MGEARGMARVDAGAEAVRGAVTAVVMAKAGEPGRVKTRLIPAIGAEAAAAVHRAMLACVLRRLADGWAGPRVLAVAGDPARLGAEAAGWRVVDQGDGDLGDRLERVWRGPAVGGGAVAFFGVDSPDAPAAAWRAIDRVLAGAREGVGDGAEAAVGPVADGGYWTLAARSADRGAALLRGIDWGSERVLGQTRAAAAGAGLRLAELDAWHDVDDADDLAALRRRLADADATADPALAELAAALDTALRP
ncbi:MAG: DUF2064 domain-containing protein [Planctomycetota bacterium]